MYSADIEETHGLFHGKYVERQIFTEKLHKIFRVKGFCHGSVELHESRIFFIWAVAGWKEESFEKAEQKILLFLSKGQWTYGPTYCTEKTSGAKMAPPLEPFHGT